MLLLFVNVLAVQLDQHGVIDFSIESVIHGVQIDVVAVRGQLGAGWGIRPPARRLGIGSSIPMS